jgi:hypothetical protein
MFGKWPMRITILSAATDMVTGIRIRTTDARRFFIDLVEFPTLCGAFQWSKRFFLSKLKCRRVAGIEFV